MNFVEDLTHRLLSNNWQEYIDTKRRTFLKKNCIIHISKFNEVEFMKFHKTEYTNKPLVHKFLFKTETPKENNNEIYCPV